MTMAWKRNDAEEILPIQRSRKFTKQTKALSESYDTLLTAPLRGKQTPRRDIPAGENEVEENNDQQERTGRDQLMRGDERFSAWGGFLR